MKIPKYDNIVNKEAKNPLEQIIYDFEPAAGIPYTEFREDLQRLVDWLLYQRDTNYHCAVCGETPDGPFYCPEHKG